MNKRLFLLLFSVILCASVRAQASFKYTIAKKSASLLVMTFTGTVEKGWHADATISFEECNGLKPQGELKKVGANTYTQTLHINQKHCSTKGYLRYIVCNDKECLAPKYLDFAYDSQKQVVNSASKASKKNEKVAKKADKNAKKAGNKAKKATAKK